MRGQLTLFRWIRLSQATHAVALSDDGRYVICGVEGGAALYNTSGLCLYTYPDPLDEMPVHRLAALPAFDRIYLATRVGQIIGLTLEPAAEWWRGQVAELTTIPGDIHSIAVSEDGALIAIGHLSPALSLMNADGQFRWQHHPDGDTMVDGSVWSVALERDGSTLYAGSAGPDFPTLATFDTHGGTLRAALRFDARVTAIAALPQQAGVVIVQADDAYSGRIAAYSSNLRTLLWEHACDEPITALATDPEQPVVSAAIGYEGQIALYDAATGSKLADQVPLKTIVNGLAISRGRTVAAATQDGHLALLRYVAEDRRV
jgi:WD40 repeat protein